MNLEVAPTDSSFWQDREDLSNEFMRLLAAAQDGRSTVAECMLTAGRIEIGDDASWHREWKRIADVSMGRGDAAAGNGNQVTARANWLRAITYYGAALFSLDTTDERRQVAFAGMRDCAGRYLRCRKPAGEVVTIPWLEGYPLQGYFLPAEAPTGRAPAVICIGEPDRLKEELLSKLDHHGRDRGLSLLVVDLLGEGTGDRLDEVLGRPDMELAISQFMNYLAERDDIDEHRIAILADEWSSSFVARGVAKDPRFAAAVCDGGIWDLHERAFLAVRRASVDGEIVPDAEAGRIARNIACPLLITLGERGWLKADRVARMVERLKISHSDLTFRVFEASETAAAQGHADNPTLANEFIFDWIASRLG